MINNRAMLLANEYIKNRDKDDRLKQIEETEFEKIFLVYKFLETPESLIKHGLNLMLQRQEAGSYFKKLALKLHPDKNLHPNSKEAFQKLKMSLDSVKKTAQNLLYT